MLVVDTSALISLAAGGVFELVIDEFDVAITETVLTELKETASYDDRHARAATAILEKVERLNVVSGSGESPLTSTIDAGEASCVVAVQEYDASFLITDDFRALPELQQLVDAEVALSPIVLRALVKRGVLEEEAALRRFETIANERDWLGAPIYRYARTLFSEK